MGKLEPFKQPMNHTQGVTYIQLSNAGGHKGSDIGLVQEIVYMTLISLPLLYSLTKTCTVIQQWVLYCMHLVMVM